MNILIQNTYLYKKRTLNCWHRWFAWYPVCVHVYPDGAKKYTIFKYVLRKIYISSDEVGNEYRYYKEVE